MSRTQEFISQMYVKIDGASASEKIMHAIREIEVDTSLYLPDMFSIQFDDTDLSLMDSTTLDVGKTVEITAKAAGDNSSKLLTKGEIVAIEPEFNEDIGTTITIRGYDKSHRLYRGKKNRVFTQVTDSDIIKKVAQEHSVTAEPDSTSVVYDHVFQDNQTDMEFIHTLARRNGFFSYFENGKLFFTKSSVASGVNLEWGKNLTHFQAHYTSANKIDKSEVRGWDVKKKEAITGLGQPTGSNKQPGAAAIKASFGSASGIAGYQAISASDAETQAKANFGESERSYLQAEGNCLGNPSVRAGKEVKIKGIGARFSGDYLVTRAIHRYDLSGYVTEFEFSGYHANTITQILGGKSGENPYGVVVGIVTNLSDPDGLARVKVKFPTISENLESHWARLATPMAGSGRGFEFIPEVEDEVLVAFEHNDISKPYVIGGLWNGKDKPPLNNNELIDNGKIKKRIIKSSSGHQIIFDDSANGEKISIIDKTGTNKIVIDSTNKSLSIQTDQKVEIQTKSGQKITLDDMAKKIEVVSGGNSVKIDGIQNSVNIESAAQLKIKAQMIQIEGAFLTLKADSVMNIESAMTTVKGSGMLTLQGGLVKIN
jgi:phage protein D/phage baseplate assembly protein gpV